MARSDPGAGQDRVLETVGEREPGRVQQVRRAPDRRPGLDPGRDSGETDADLTARPLAVARDRGAEVGQRDAREVRVGGDERTADRLLDRIDRPEPGRLAAQHLVADADLGRRGRGAAVVVLALARVDGVGERLERRVIAVRRAAQEQLERRLRVLELKALVLELLDPRGDGLRRRRRRIDLEPELASALDHVAAAALLADDDVPPVADRARIEVLVRSRVGGDRVDVDAALVRERSVADERQPPVRLDVGDVVDETRELGQAVEVLARRTLDPELEHEVRDDRGQVRVPGALAVAVDRALHLARTRGHRRERVGHRELAVVVRVDADAGSERADGVGDGLGDLAGERAAVRVAEDEPVGARVGGGLQDGQRVVAIRAVAVEEVLRRRRRPRGRSPSGTRPSRRPSPGSPRASSAARRRRGSPRPWRRARPSASRPRAAAGDRRRPRPARPRGACCRTRSRAPAAALPRARRRRTASPSGSRPASRPRCSRRRIRPASARSRACRGATARCRCLGSRRAAWCRRS